MVWYGSPQSSAEERRASTTSVARFSGRVGVQDLAAQSDAPGRSDVFRPALDDAEHGVAAGEIGIADVGQDPDQARDAVDRAWKDLADADRADGVDRARPLSGGFHRERDLGGGQEGVAAIGHEHRAGMAALAFDLECSEWPAPRLR